MKKLQSTKRFWVFFYDRFNNLQFWEQGTYLKNSICSEFCFMMNSLSSDEYNEMGISPKPDFHYRNTEYVLIHERYLNCFKKTLGPIFTQFFSLSGKKISHVKFTGIPQDKKLTQDDLRFYYDMHVSQPVSIGELARYQKKKHKKAA